MRRAEGGPKRGKQPLPLEGGGHREARRGGLRRREAQGGAPPARAPNPSAPRRTATGRRRREGACADLREGVTTGKARKEN